MMVSSAWMLQPAVGLMVSLLGVVTAQNWRSSSEYGVLDCPVGVSVPTDLGRAWAKVMWVEPRFLDLDGLEVVPTRISHSPGQRFPVGSHTVRYTLTDGAHKVWCSFVVTVDDEEPPRITNCPSDITVPADGGSTTRASVTWGRPAATDNFRVKQFGSTHAVGSGFALGRTPVTYTAVDLKGNQAECTFNVIVTDEETPFLDGCPAEAVSYVGPTASSGLVTWTPPRAHDNAGPPKVTCTRSAGERYPLGRTAVACTARDAAGNAAVCNFDVLVKVEIPGNKIFLSNRSSTSLEITWPQHVDRRASSYLIYAWPEAGERPLASDHVYHPINWRESFAARTLGGLAPGTAYYVRIYVTGVGNELGAKFRTEPNVPTGVGYAADSLESTSVELTWRPPTGNYDQYQIAYHRLDVGGAPSAVRVPDKMVTRRRVGDLDPDTTYVFSLVSLSGVGASMTQSDPVSLTITTAPLPQSQILLQKVTASTIQIVARMVPAETPAGRTPAGTGRRAGAAAGGGPDPRLRAGVTVGVVRPPAEDEADDSHHSDGHVILIFSNESDVFADVVFRPGTLKYEFNSLAPTTLYTMRIIPSGASGGHLEKVTMTRPATVSDLVLSEVTNSSVTVSWTAPPGRVDGYRVSCVPDARGGPGPVAVPAAARRATVAGLVPLTAHVLSVVTVFGELASEAASLEVTPGVDRPVSTLHMEVETSCMSPILASGLLSGILLLIGIYVCRLKMCYKHLATHRSRSEENPYENPTRPNSDCIGSPPYQNRPDPSEAMAMLLRGHTPPISVSGYMYPPMARRLIGKGKRASKEESTDNDSGLAPIYYNVKDGES